MARYSAALWRPCSKWGYDNIMYQAPKRVTVHSAEGYRTAMFGVLDGPKETSWHFSVMKNGEVWQHINTRLIAWHAGNQANNTDNIGIECEGKKGEPLTPAQFLSLVKLLIWLFVVHRVTLGPPERPINLIEHGEIYNTSCPSGRIPWAKLLDAMEDDMTPEEVRTIVDEKLNEFKKLLFTDAREAKLASLKTDESTQQSKDILTRVSKFLQDAANRMTEGL